MCIFVIDVIVISIVSDYDFLFVCINVGVDWYLNIVYLFDNLEEQLEYLNSMFQECIERYVFFWRERVMSFGQRIVKYGYYYSGMLEIS